MRFFAVNRGFLGAGDKRREGREWSSREVSDVVTVGQGNFVLVRNFVSSWFLTENVMRLNVLIGSEKSFELVSTCLKLNECVEDTFQLLEFNRVPGWHCQNYLEMS